MTIDDVWDRAVERQQRARTCTVHKDGYAVWCTGSTQTCGMQLTNKQYMDLITAQRQAKADSAKDKKRLFFINIDDEGESSVSNEFDAATSAYCYKGGNEVALPAAEAAPIKVSKRKQRLSEKIMEQAAAVEAKESKNKTTQQTVATTNADMKTAATKKAAAKKGGKVAAKKAAHRTVSAERAAQIKARTTGGKKVDISIGQMEKNTKAGKVFYKDPQGTRQTLDGFKARTNKDFIRKGMFEFKVVAE